MATKADEAARASVDTPNEEWELMNTRWDLIGRLSSGSQAMREARERLLPMEGGEELADYENRLARSFLYPGFKDAVAKLSSKPFEEPVKLELVGALPEMLDALQTDCDRTGSDLTKFAKALFADAVRHGHTHILVDYPKRGPMGAPLSLADVRKDDIRPYFTHVTARALFAWRSRLNEANVRRASQVRFMELISEPSGQFGSFHSKIIRVWDERTYQLWRKDPDGSKFLPVSDPVPHTFDGVPIVTIYFDDDHGFMVSEPPLWSLAETNLCHWQSYSDQRNALRFARMAILHQTGVSVDDVKKPLKIGPTATVRTTNPASTLAFVEHSGASMKIGADDLETLKRDMDDLAGQPLMIRPSGSLTATEKAIDEGKAAATILAWIRALETGIENAYALAAEWIGATMPKDFRVNIYSDFALTFKSSEDTTVLTQARTSGNLSQRTYLEEIQRRGVLSDKVDIDEELDRIANEAPPPPDLEAIASAAAAGATAQANGQQPPPGDAGDAGDTGDDQDEGDTGDDAAAAPGAQRAAFASA